MTVSQFKSELQQFSETFRTSDGESMADIVIGNYHLWSGKACRMYCIKAMERTGATAAQIKAVQKEMSYLFESMSIDGAEKLYNKLY